MRKPESTKKSQTPSCPQGTYRKPGRPLIPQCSNQTAKTASAAQRIQLRHVPNRQRPIRPVRLIIQRRRIHTGRLG